MEGVGSLLTDLVVRKHVTGPASQAYDAAIKKHIATLAGQYAFTRTVVLGEARRLFEILTPASHTISYLFALEVLLDSGDSAPSIEREFMLDRVVDFLVGFDPVQIRYVGQAMRSLLETVGSGQLFPPLVAVELITTAVLRIDPRASLFTSTHLLLAKLAYHSNAVELALPVLDRDVLFYPNMYDSRESKPLCDKTLAPASYISTHTGLTDTIRASKVLEYNYVRGLIYMSRREWSKAEEAFRQIITHPAKDRGVSRIMVEAYKRWILVGLLSHGKAPTAPASTSNAAGSAYKTAAKAYTNVADSFGAAEADKLGSHMLENASIWEEDGTASLMAEVLSSYQKWQIMGLRAVYSRVEIAQVRGLTLNAETGQPLQNDEEVLALINEMLEAKMFDGQVERDDSGTFLSFTQDDDVLSEADFARHMARSHMTINELGGEYRRMNDRLSSTKEFIKLVVKEQKRAERDAADAADAGVGFDSQIEDEDLMAGIVARA